MFVRVLAAAILAMAVSCGANAAVAPSHASRGIACAVCHGEAAKPSSDNVSEQPCLKCHGEQPPGKPFEYIGKTVANVHAGHFDVYECLVCHKGHKESFFACAECHKAAVPVP